MVVQKSGAQWLDGFFGTHDVGNVAERGYCLRVALAGYRVTPRDTQFEYMREL